MEPDLNALGFQLLKSDITFKRKKEGFSQEVHFALNNRNSGSSIVVFWLILSVRSSFYTKWHLDTYHQEAMNDHINSWDSINNSKLETPYSRSGHYDLTQHDNVKLMVTVREALMQRGIELLDRSSDWQGAADQLMEEKKYGSVAKIFDFYILSGHIGKAEDSLQFIEDHYKQTGNIPEKRFEEIRIRRAYLKSLT
ncbi:MAG: hypothetical protein KDB88_11735 [Flavobacteriales bacterium]|nr:hypothetical protein [Flavobacteriales bacterium]